MLIFKETDENFTKLELLRFKAHPAGFNQLLPTTDEEEVQAAKNFKRVKVLLKVFKIRMNYFMTVSL